MSNIGICISRLSRVLSNVNGILIFHPCHSGVSGSSVTKGGPARAAHAANNTQTIIVIGPILAPPSIRVMLNSHTNFAACGSE